MLIRKCLAPEGVADSGGGGGGGGDTGGSAPAAPSRGRMGDFSGIDSATPSGGPRIAPPRSNPREPMPGDEGLEPAGNEPPPDDDGASVLDVANDDIDAGDTGEGDDQLDGDGIDAAADFETPVLGMSPGEFMAAIRSGVLPKELAEQILDLPDEVVIDGVAYTMTREEMKKAAMRGADYSRKMTDLSRLRREAQDAIASDTQRWETWSKDPEALWNDFVQRGMCDVTAESGPLYEIAMHIADQRSKWLAMSPAEQNAYRSEQRARARELAAEAREAEINRKASEQDHASSKTFFATELARLVPETFAKLQVKHSKLAERLFKDQLRLVKEGVPDNEIRRRLPELIHQAASNAREELIALGRLEKPDPRPANGQRTQQPARQPQRHVGGPPPTSLGGPPPRPGTTGNGVGRKRMRMGDLTPLYKRR